MTQTHHIRRFTAEVDCAEPVLALALQEQIPGFVQSRLKHLVGEVMDAVCPENETVRLTRLVVDLGHIGPDRFEQELAERLRKALQDALATQITPLIRSPFEEMAGRLFAIIQSGSHQNIDPYWIPMLAAFGRETRALFRQRGKSALVRKHIAWLFPTERIRELVRLFEPYHHRFITYFMDRPEALMAREQLKAETPGTFRRQVAEFILAYLLVEQGSRFNKKIFLASVIGQISSHYNIRYDGLLKSLIGLFRISKENSPVRREILEFLLDLEGQAPAGHSPAMTGDGFSLEDFPVEPPMGTAAESRGLARIMQREPGTLVRFLDRHRKEPAMIRRLAQALDTPFLMRLVDQVHPGRSHAVLAYARALDQTYYARIFAGSEKRARSLVWEAVLAFVPPFEERGFCRALIRHLARSRESGPDRQRFYSRLVIRLVLDARKTRAHYDLLKAVLELKGIQSGLELLREKGIENLDNALAFFRHYLARKENRRRMARKFSRERLGKLIRLVLPFEHDLIQGTLGAARAGFRLGGGQGEDRFMAGLYDVTLDFMAPDQVLGFSRKNYVARIIREMAGFTGLSFSSQLRIFTTRVADSKNPVSQALAAIAGDIEKDLNQDRQMVSHGNSARSLVMIYLTRILPEHGNETSYLMNAVRRYERRAKDTEAFYAAILDKLILKGTIDFEALLAQPPAAAPLPAHKTRDSGKSGLRSRIQSLLNRGPKLLLDFVRTHLPRQGFMELLVGALTVPELNRLVFLLRPREYVDIQRAVAVLESGLISALGLCAGKETERVVWLGVLSGMARTGFSHDLDLSLFTRGFLDKVAGLLPLAGGQRLPERLIQVLESQAPGLAHQKTFQTILRALSAGTAEKEVQRPGAEKAGTIKAAPAVRESLSSPSQVLETLYIHNAGLVLAAPYLPSLFKMLALEDLGQFKSMSAALKAIRVLQYMADPRDDTPLVHLVLNRILCGIDPPLPDDTGELPDPKEKETADSLIQGMIQNWKTIQNTSVEGFRESFFQRKGALTLETDQCWHLKVEARAFDLLLDTVPWQFGTIRLPWMSRLLYVKWR